MAKLHSKKKTKICRIGSWDQFHQHLSAKRKCISAQNLAKKIPLSFTNKFGPKTAPVSMPTLLYFCANLLFFTLYTKKSGVNQLVEKLLVK